MEILKAWQRVLLADGRVRYLELNRLSSLRSGHRLLLRIEGPLATKNQRRAQSELQRTKKKILERRGRLLSCRPGRAASELFRLAKGNHDVFGKGGWWWFYITT